MCVCVCVCVCVPQCSCLPLYKYIVYIYSTVRMNTSLQGPLAHNTVLNVPLLLPRLQPSHRMERGGTTERRKTKNPTPSGSCRPGIPGPLLTLQQRGPLWHSSSCFFSTSVVRTIIDNTNTNAARRIEAGGKFTWKTLTVKEFYMLLCIIVFTGLVHVHHRGDYWRKQWPYNFNFPHKKMSRD